MWLRNLQGYLKASFLISTSDICQFCCYDSRDHLDCDWRKVRGAVLAAACLKFILLWTLWKFTFKINLFVFYF